MYGYNYQRQEYNLFISHSWSYSDNYNKLCGMLDAAINFKYKNYSVPKNDPIHNANNDAQLRAAIRLQMQYATVVVILAGVYATYSKWINIEIEEAKKMGKKIVAIEPWGSERTSSVVKQNADRIVKWNTSSIVSAIKELAD